MNTTNINYKDLREEFEARYFVQWMTATNRHGELIIMGYCVRDRETIEWTSVFKHESKEVCQKIADMLNEGEVTKC